MPYIQSGFNYSPYRQARETLQQTAAGQTANAGTGIRARLASQGMSGMPGATEAAINRARYSSTQAIAPALANIDLQGAKDEQAYLQWKAQFDEAKRQAREAKSWREKNLWLEGISTLIGVGATIAGGAIAGAGAKSAAELLKESIIGKEPSVNAAPTRPTPTYPMIDSGFNPYYGGSPRQRNFGGMGG